MLNLTKPSSSFLGALSLSAFSIASPKALQEYGADEGTVDADGIFHPTGKYGTEHPTGTGPFKFESWTVGDRLVLARNDDYWGDKAKLDKVIFRPIADNAARLQALQTGEIQGYDLVEPQDIADDRGRLEPAAPQPAGVQRRLRRHQPGDPADGQARGAPGDRLRPRTGRRSSTRSTRGRGQVAKEFMPPEVVGYADDVTEYEYDPEKSKQLLQAAGLTLPVQITFWYPTDVSRPYMPDPQRNFEAFAASLNEAGFKVTPKSAPWRPDYLGTVDEGKAAASTCSAGRVTTVTRTTSSARSSRARRRPGGRSTSRTQEVTDLLDEAETETDIDARTALYQDANRTIMDWLPGVPYAHSQPALAFKAGITGYEPSPVSLESFATVIEGVGIAK